MPNKRQNGKKRHLTFQLALKLHNGLYQKHKENYLVGVSMYQKVRSFLLYLMAILTKSVKNHSEKWHFLTSFGYYLSFHFFPFGFEAAQGKEIQIILRLFLVCHLLLQTKSVPSQLASNRGG